MFDISKVTRVYSGRQGCACGCRGKYSYQEKFRDLRPSYYEGDEGVSDASVRIIVRRVEQALHQPEFVRRVMVCDDFLAVDMMHDRTYTIYFGEAEHEKREAA